MDIFRWFLFLKVQTHHRIIILVVFGVYFSRQVPHTFPKPVFLETSYASCAFFVLFQFVALIKSYEGIARFYLFLHSPVFLFQVDFYRVNVCVCILFGIELILFQHNWWLLTESRNKRNNKTTTKKIQNTFAVAHRIRSWRILFARTRSLILRFFTFFLSLSP